MEERMLAGLWRRAVRGPWGRRTHPGPGGGTPRSGADGGFTLVEVIVSISLMTITMTALTTFFVLTGSSAAHQSGSQAAAQLAQDAMDQARSLKGSAVITGRAKCGGANACAVPAAAVAPYLADIEEWDYVPAGNTPQLPTSTTATLNGLTFAENWYVGKCWQASGGGPCTQDPTNAPIVLYRVIAAVTWPEKSCPGNTCAFVTTTLISSAATSPLFNSNQTAQPPAVNKPGNHTDERTFPVNLTMTADGGAPVVTWSATGLPPGVTLSPTGVFSGTPTTTGSYPVLVTAKDGFNLTGTAAFTWTIAPPPSVTTPAAQTADINLAITPLTGTAANRVP